MDLIYVLDLVGTLVFAVSGTLAAADKKLDIFGASVIAFATAIGGGTIRDILIGSLPVGWMSDLSYLLMIFLGVLISFFFKKFVLKLRNTLFLFDTIGIALFTILGIEKTLSFGLSPIVAVMMGTTSAVFGGVLRDILSNEIPLIFRKEIYATACIAGGMLFLILKASGLSTNYTVIATTIFIVTIRVLSVKYRWSLPQIR